MSCAESVADGDSRIAEDITTLAAERPNSTTGRTDLQPSIEDVADESDHEARNTDESLVEDDDVASSETPTPSVDADGDIKRWPSLRTEALIQAAARDIVAHVATRPRDSLESVSEGERPDDSSLGEESPPGSSRGSLGSRSDAGQSQASDERPARLGLHGHEARDDGSHRGHEDDVFSHHSPRSSMGSMSEAEQKRAPPQKTQAPRISDISQTDRHGDFVPTVRTTPRPPFRSPSSVKAIQMSSPPPSVLGSPRTSRHTPRNSFSRLASPSLSTQFSPKKTPPRFKRNTPPLVLLHVTLMPSRWAWGRILDNAHPSELSPEGRMLRESWRQLQDRVRDTVSDRGILLPHPQNDYEVLEERLLETLELPLRRRARILECGHYLGPSNEMSLQEDTESDDDEHHGERRSPGEVAGRTTHWCNLCLSEIKFESLGAGKVYRVKVYASNGLLRAGAWEACWREMERVDVEVEPIVEAKLQEELANLAAEQERVLNMEEEEAAAAAAAAAIDEELERREAAEAEAAIKVEVDGRAYVHRHSDVAPEPEIPRESSSPYEDDRRARDEERLREIYGHTPTVFPDHSSPIQSRHSDFTTKQRSSSPGTDAFDRRQDRREEQHGARRSASLPELILEAVKILFQDQKNIMIAILGLVVLTLAMRSSSPTDTSHIENVTAPAHELQAHIEERVQTHSRRSAATSVEPAWGTMEIEQGLTAASALGPYEACSKALQTAEMSLRSLPTSTVSLVTTVTSEVPFTVTETIVQTMTVDAILATSVMTGEPTTEARDPEDKGVPAAPAPLVAAFEEKSESSAA